MEIVKGNCKRCGIEVQSQTTVEEDLANLLHQPVRETQDVISGEMSHEHPILPDYCPKCEKLIKNEVY